MNRQEQDQIKRLEESNQELKRQIELQAKQIEALKSSAQSDEERFAPYSGPGYLVSTGYGSEDGYEDVIETNPNYKWKIYNNYRTQEQAKWERKATQVRRKLQRICAVLGPAEGGDRTYFVVEDDYHVVKFARLEDARKAEQLLGDDLKYLDWNNSPEAQDARDGKV